jgi:peptidoglycan biosynthesis protein MviN/MurJ (putative lipid II flippase)
MDDSPTDSQEDSQRGRMFQRVRIVGLLTFLSRILGLLRDAVMVASFGNGAIMDAFTIAFRVPNMARQIFGEGALSTAFLPVFIQDIKPRLPSSPSQRSDCWQSSSSLNSHFSASASLFPCLTKRACC